jgi:hypothetical protein
MSAHQNEPRYLNTTRKRGPSSRSAGRLLCSCAQAALLSVPMTVSLGIALPGPARADTISTTINRSVTIGNPGYVSPLAAAYPLSKA